MNAPTTQDKPPLHECYDQRGKPLRCRECGHDKFKCRVTEIMGGTVCQYEERCEACNNKAAHWSYGSYEQ
jgi:hypothetical protein